MDALTEYIKVTSQLKELDSKKKELASALIDQFNEDKVDQVTTEIGTLTLAHRKSYTYSDVIADMADELKIKKKLEEQTGKAVFKEKPYLMWRAK